MQVVVLLGVVGGPGGTPGCWGLGPRPGLAEHRHAPLCSFLHNDDES